MLSYLLVVVRRHRRNQGAQLVFEQAGIIFQDDDACGGIGVGRRRIHRRERRPDRVSACVSSHKESSGSKWAMGYVLTQMRIQSAFEQAGILFQEEDAGGGIGVRLVKKSR
jgi:hypothetical protein